MLSEKAMSIRFGRTLVTGFTKVLKPDEFEDFNAFAAEIQKQWDALWAEVYGADPKGLKPLSTSGAQAYGYPTAVKLQQLAITTASLAVLAGVLYGSWRCLTALLALAGSWQQVVAGGAGLWVAASMLQSIL